MRRSIRRFGHAKAGAVAIEFAMVMPLLMAMMFGGYAVSQAVMVSRKLTITTRALADLTKQVTNLTADDMTTLLNAATQIIAPFNAGALGMRLTEVATDPKGVATVIWSTGRNLTAYARGATLTLPTGMQASTTYIYSETQYAFVPAVSFGVSGFTMNERIFMLPRLSSTVSYAGS